MSADAPAPLDGAAAESARAACDAIAASLPAPDPEAHPGPAGGSMGYALFYTAYAEVTGSEEATATATAHAEAAFEAVAQRSGVEPGLYGTPVGVGWALGALEGRLIEPDPDENDVDVVAGKLLAMTPWPGSFDLIRGTVGLGVYALSRLPRETADAGVRDAVARLAAGAVETDDGLVWPDDLHPERGEHVDVGLAHGQAGVVAFLANALRAGYGDAAPVLDGALTWLRAQRDPHADPGHQFPASVAADGTRRPSRLAWCYGDPGGAVALLSAANALDDDIVRGEALDVARGCAGRAEPGVKDAGLCHGWAGLGHVFGRLGRGLGDPEVLALSARCLREAVAAWVPGEGVGGYVAYQPVQGVYTPDPGLLEGAAGIGLALLSALSPGEPRWDGLLLLDGCV